MSDFEITDEVKNHLIDLWAKSGIHCEETAIEIAVKAYPNISPLSVPSIWTEWMRDSFY